jgi:hypothetical protein
MLQSNLFAAIDTKLLVQMRLSMGINAKTAYKRKDDDICRNRINVTQLMDSLGIFGNSCDKTRIFSPLISTLN